MAVHVGLQVADRLCFAKNEGYFGHLVLSAFPFAALRLRESADPVEKEAVLYAGVIVSLLKGRDIARKGLPQIMDQAHADDLVHIKIPVFINTGHQHSHQGDPPAVVSDTLFPAFFRIAVPCCHLETACPGKDPQ